MEVSDERCEGCAVFQKMHGGRTGGGIQCIKDSTEGGKRKVYAKDYACSNIVRVEADANAGRE